MKYLFIILIIILLILLYIGISFFYLYLKNKKIISKWDKIVAQLQRRYDLIPNLIETVSCTIDNEQETINKIIKSRTVLIKAETVDEKAEANIEMESSLEKILDLSKTHKKLGMSKNYLLIEKEINDVNEQIKEYKKKYNNLVMEYNTYISNFPGTIISNFLNYSPRDYFKCK